MSYLKKLKDIIQGFKNHWFDNDKVKESSELKAKICADCPLNVDNYCSKKKQGIAIKDFEYNEELRYKGRIYNGCGCYLPAKLKSDSKCPIGNF